MEYVSNHGWSLLRQFYLILFLIKSQWVQCEQLLHINFDNHAEQAVMILNDTMFAYSLGVYMGIINPQKYSLRTFQWDERQIFKDLYRDYLSMNVSQPINYQEWLVINNFGLYPDSQTSLFEKKSNDRSTADNKRLFMKTVKKGDILITTKGIGGLPGHAAIMLSNYWVLEMAGGYGWENGIVDNNRQMGKNEWYDEYSTNWITVYRCPDQTVARDAAIWADFNYYNPFGGSKKLIHITYLITNDLYSTNPSYCSKLVIQAYYFGSGTKIVTKELNEIKNAILPTAIPKYFRKPFTLINIGKF